MFKIALSLFFMFFLITHADASVSISTSKTTSVSVLKGSILTVKLPCPARAIYNPDAADVKGIGSIASILAHENTSISFICTTGDAGYIVSIRLTDNQDESKNYIEIVDKPRVDELDNRRLITDVSDYDKEDVLLNARNLLVGIVQSASVPGYERQANIGIVNSPDKSLQVKLAGFYMGRLIGFEYKLTNISHIRIRRNVSDFSTRGVVLVFSPSADKSGDILILPRQTVKLYMVKVPHTDVATSRTVVPWIGARDAKADVGDRLKRITDADGAVPQKQNIKPQQVDEVLGRIERYFTDVDMDNVVPPGIR